jgi:hypothetical protein
MDQALKDLIGRFPPISVPLDADVPSSVTLDALLLTVDAELLHIEGWAETLGVSISMERDENGALFLSDLARERSDASTRGNGARVMEKLCELADAHGLPFETSYMTDEPGLRAYYERFGFVAEDEPGLLTNMLRKGPSRH